MAPQDYAEGRMGFHAPAPVLPGLFAQEWLPFSRSLAMFLARCSTVLKVERH